MLVAATTEGPVLYVTGVLWSAQGIRAELARREHKWAREGSCGANAGWPAKLRQTRFESADRVREASRSTWGTRELAREVWLAAGGSRMAQN